MISIRLEHLGATLGFAFLYPTLLHGLVRGVQLKAAGLYAMTRISNYVMFVV
jgi:hypothetical protein